MDRSSSLVVNADYCRYDLYGESNLVSREAGKTDLSIFLGWGEVLMRLCPMWLGLVALCYLWTGVEMRSRTFFLTGIIHLLAILILPLVEGWQFLTTGIVMGLSVVLLAEFRWDMRHKIDWDLLTPEQKLYI